MSCVSAADTCPVSTEDISPVSTADVKFWTAEVATAADQINDRESLACGGRDSGRPKSLHGAMDDPSLTAKQTKHRHIRAGQANKMKVDVSGVVGYVTARTPRELSDRSKVE